MRLKKAIEKLNKELQKPSGQIYTAALEIREAYHENLSRDETDPDEIIETLLDRCEELGKEPGDILVIMMKALTSKFIHVGSIWRLRGKAFSDLLDVKILSIKQDEITHTGLFGVPETISIQNFFLVFDAHVED